MLRTVPQTNLTRILLHKSCTQAIDDFVHLMARLVVDMLVVAASIEMIIIETMRHVAFLHVQLIIDFRDVLRLLQSILLMTTG